MANIKSAKKRIKVIDKKTARNIRVKNHVKEAEKAFLAAIAAGDAEGAEKAFKLAEKKLMQAAAKGTFHKKAASRTVARFAKKLNALKSGEAPKAEPAKKAVKKAAPVEEAPVVEETVKADASMKKDELLAIAEKMGIEVPAKATKADILAAIEAK
ncbi:MAG: 30S ribosomal protein S20 [Clostridiales bacterium]|nr:30S ribosomal protein S20 [Candidatus Crickella caballi]